MQITFSLPHVFDTQAQSVDNARALRALLDCLIALDLAYLRNHTVPALYQSGVVYGRTEIWDTIPGMYARGYGDCKSLTAARIAELRRDGLYADPVFRFISNGRNGQNYHILVQTNQGFEDPSKLLGMGRDENKWFKGR